MAEEEKQGVRRIRSVVLCSVCDAVYEGWAGPHEDLPCGVGHKPKCWMVDSAVQDAVMDQSVLEWLDMYDDDVLDDVVDAIEVAGGHYDLHKIGHARLALPPRPEDESLAKVSFDELKRKEAKDE